MKKIFSRTHIKVTAFIVLYLAGLAIGIFVIGIYPIYAHQREGSIKHSRTIAEEYLSGSTEELEMMRNAYRHIIITDAAGSCIYLSTFDKSHDATDFLHFLNTWIPKTLNGEECFAITTSKFSPAPLHFWMTTGVPITRGGIVQGAVFMIENIQNLPEASLGFVIYFTIFYWIVVYLLIITARKRQKLDEIRQDYVANVTHALKTPTASIKAMTEALCDDMIESEDMKKVYYGKILGEVNSQNRMVSKILELSRIQSLQGALEKTKVSSGELFDEVTEHYAMLCDCTDIFLHVSGSMAQLPIMYTNKDSIRQIMELILDNAIKFVPEGGNVWIDQKTERKKVIISIRDDGPGIEEKDMPHIFERFYRCNKNDGASKGSGLGLAIVHELCLALGEKVWAESRPGDGTTFYFTISRG